MKKKILVVDDNRMILKFLSNLLDGEGHEVKTCEDGLSALSLLTTYQPEIVFVDLIIPKIGGDKLCQIIRTMEHMKNCYLVIISAAVAEMDLDFRKIGVNACIAKGPFGQMGKHVLAAINDSSNPSKSVSEHKILGIASVNGIPVYARRMTKELLGRNRHLETILESVNEGIVEVYAGRVVYANSAAVKLFAIPLENLLSAKPRDLFDEASRSRIDVLMTRDPEKSQVVGLTRPLGLNGREIVIRSFPVKAEADTTILLIADVTDQRDLEYQLQHVRRMDAIGNLAGGIAHNFNNLLMGIQGNVSILIQDKKVGDPGYDELGGIERCIDSGAKLTRQLLSFAKGGRYSLDLEDVNDIVEKSSSMFARTRKEIHVDWHLEDELATAEVDAAQIELALMDLYVNAWHAMSNGGTLTVSTANVTLDESFVKPFHLTPGSYLKIDVADTGAGMDEKTVERIFEPFYTTRPMGQGTGLGLASVFGIIKKHQGIITVDSQVGSGTTFSIYLPAARILQKPKDRDKLRVISSGKLPEKGSGTILVVDDEEYILNADKAMLNELGYEVLLAKGGKEALRVFDENKDRIKLLILDLIMPDLGGEIVYDRIKFLQPDIRVILSSGYSIEGQAESILKKGCDGFIQKPYNLNKLARKIKEILA
ncbi:MAG: response regulator [Desulfosarcina sp.]|nr:response regulator [Desulfosarcina sp.]MBC2743519.1 response regulator [Desulfosarcina sp.]MBC2766428.1 response regulator [Desulfosarcina sp.]